MKYKVKAWLREALMVVWCFLPEGRMADWVGELRYSEFFAEFWKID